MCVHNANVYANIYTDEEHPAQLIIAKMLKLTLIYEYTTDEHHHKPDRSCDVELLGHLLDCFPYLQRGNIMSSY